MTDDARRPVRVATCWTTAGAVVPGDVDAASPEDLRDRVAAAAAAGFDGFGINHPDLAVARERYGAKEIRAILDGNGMRHLELEVLTGWSSSGDARRAADARRDALLGAAAELGADLVKVIADIGPAPASADALVEAFADLVERAGAAGARIGIEPVVVCQVATLAQALDLVRRAGRLGGGVVLDNWQLARSGLRVGDVRDVPVEWVASAELSDGPAEPLADFGSDCFDHRGLPGTGGLDVAGFVDALRGTGYDGVWGVEVLDARYRRLPLTEATAVAYDALDAVLDDRTELSTRRPRPGRARSCGATPGPASAGAPTPGPSPAP